MHIVKHAYIFPYGYALDIFYVHFKFKVFRAVNCLLGLLVLIALHHNASAALTESEMKAKLAAYNKEALKQCNRSVKAGWNVATDVGNAEKEKERVCI